MLRVQIGLGTMRARKLSVSVFLRDLVLGRCRASGRSGRPPGGTGQDAAATLRTNHMGWLLAVLEDRGLWHQRALRIGRGHARLRHDTASRHGAQHRRDTATGRRSRGNGLRVGRGHRGLGQHAGRGRVRLVRLLVRVVGHHLVGASPSVLGRRRRIAAHVGAGSVGSSWSARRVRVARVDRLHTWVMRLQRGQGVRLTLLKMVRRDR